MTNKYSNPPPAPAPFSNYQSILDRPIKKSKYYSNAENSEKEYEREQKRIEARRARFSQLHENRRISLWGNPEEKAKLQEQRRTEIERHLSIKEQNRKIDLLQDIQVYNQEIQAEEVIQNVERAQQLQKRSYLKGLMEDNKRLEEYRRQKYMAEKREEIEREKNEIEFFDRYKSYR
jgi:hypothetical protein